MSIANVGAKQNVTCNAHTAPDAFKVSSKDKAPSTTNRLRMDEAPRSIEELLKGIRHGDWDEFASALSKLDATQRNNYCPKDWLKNSLNTPVQDRTRGLGHLGFGAKKPFQTALSRLAAFKTTSHKEQLQVITMIKALKQRGANPHVRGSDGDDAIMTAQKSGNRGIIDSLQE
jgi:hypothetical protein